jgi:hypothetical protein
VPAVNGGVAVTTNDVVGYYDGLGGTVTQLTSKTTAVTLNKVTGKITMHNSALGANASAYFTFNNTAISASDVLVITASNVPSNGANYSIWCQSVSSGVAYIRVQNVSAGSLSEALILNFAIIKGATS